MTDNINGVVLQEKLARLSRVNSAGIKEEQAMVAATGTQPPAWTIEVVSLDSYNLYNVRQVNITTPGSDPVGVTGSNTQAYNLAESFTSSGSVLPGTFAVMWRGGSDNVFYVIP